MPDTTPKPERNAEIYRRWAVYHESMDKIAADYGISPQRVSEIVATMRKKSELTDKPAMLQRSLDLLADVNQRALEIADLIGGPVTAGKDGAIVIDPETGQVVRDYSARLAALKVAMEASEKIAKRLGLNAPDRQEVTASVRYEIAGVDPEDLS